MSAAQLPDLPDPAALAVDYGTVETVRVHFDDLDAMGVLHNSRYGVLFERALAAYWERAGWRFDPASPQFADVFFVVREFSVTYHAPITAAGDVLVHFWFDHLGRTSGVYGFRVLSASGDVLHAEGRRAQVKLDPQTLRPSPIPPSVLAACPPLFGPHVRLAHGVDGADGAHRGPQGGAEREGRGRRAAEPAGR